MLHKLRSIISYMPHDVRGDNNAITWKRNSKFLLLQLMKHCLTEYCLTKYTVVCMKFSSAEIWCFQMIYWNVINTGIWYDQIFMRYLSYQMIWCYNWSELSTDPSQIKHVNEPVDLSSSVWFHSSEIFNYYPMLTNH